MITDRNCAHISMEAVIAKSIAGQGLTLPEAAVRYDISLTTLRRYAKQEGLPMLGEKLFEADFILWRQQRAGLVAAPERSVVKRPRENPSGKLCHYP